MSVPEISIHVRNAPGQLVQVTAILAEADVSIRGIAASSNGKSGWVRLVVDNCKVAEEALDECGFDVEVGEAVAVILRDEPGELDKVLRILSDNGLNVDYIYNCESREGDRQVLIIGVQTPGKAEQVLKKDGVEIAEIRC